MKRIFCVGIMVLCASLLNQNPLCAQDSITDDPVILKEAAAFRSKIEKEKTGKDIDRDLWIAFRVDTFTIQKKLEAQLKDASERYDASFAWSDAVSAYNKIIGEYYNTLMDKMIEIDKPYLQNSQQSWLEYKQAEQVLNEIIGRKQYNKSGLINETYEYQRMLEINKHRATELLNYLLRINNR